MQTDKRTGIARHLRSCRWYTNVRLERQPLCPRCSVELHTSATFFRNGMAFCTRCTDKSRELEPLVTEAIEAHDMRKHFRGRAGLLFYCPTHFDPVAFHVLFGLEHQAEPEVEIMRGVVDIDGTYEKGKANQEGSNGRTKKKRSTRRTKKAVRSNAGGGRTPPGT